MVNVLVYKVTECPSSLFSSNIVDRVSSFTILIVAILSSNRPIHSKHSSPTIKHPQSKGKMNFLVALTVLISCTLSYASETKDLVVAEAAYSTSHYGYPSSSSHDDYGKHAASWADNGHGAYGNHDAYGDNGWGSNGLKKYGGWGSNAGYGGQHGSHGHNQGYGLYSRNRGYGYEKQWAYDKEYAKKAHNGGWGDHGSNWGHHNNHGNHGLASHNNYGHNKYGAHDKYGNSGHGRYGHILGAYGSSGHQYAAPSSSYGHSGHYEPEPYASAPIGVTYY